MSEQRMAKHSGAWRVASVARQVLGLTAVALMMAACTSEDTVPAEPEQAAKIPFHATLAAPAEGATRTVYTPDGDQINVSWKFGDKIKLLNEDKGSTDVLSVTEVKPDGSATIEGSITAGETGDNLVLSYPNTPADYNEQEGTLDYIQDNLDYRSGTATLTISEGGEAGLGGPVKLVSGIAIWKITLQDESSNPLSATKVTMNLGGVEYGTKAITAASEVYLAIGGLDALPSTVDISIEATVGSDTYIFTKSAMTLLQAGKYYQSPVKMINKKKTIPLTLEAKEDGGSINFTNKAAGPVTYKINGADAGTIPARSENVSIPVTAGDKVAFYGENATYALEGEVSIECSSIRCDLPCYVYGNIMSLVAGDDFANATTLTGGYTFLQLFASNGDNLLNHPDYELLLPATTLSEECYSEMFNGCEGLTKAPELPATTLADACYSEMFNDCIGLTTAPALPATKLTEQCYSKMFSGCEDLTTAPDLPATELAENCYSNMFYGCEDLTTAPALPATELAGSCYDYMFEGCTSLTTAPELPATTLADNCYSYMFEGCTSLTTAPELPAKTLAGSCYAFMFNDCSSLTTAPELPATTLAGSCYAHMFNDCEGLTIAPALPATELAEYCYDYMFQGCSNLSSVTCLATDIAEGWTIEECVKDWLDGVASPGTFYKAEGATFWSKGTTVPSGWDIEDAP